MERTTAVSQTPPDFFESETPPYMKWGQDFRFLMTDRDGIKLFITYLEEEGFDNWIKFWLACEGIKNKQAKSTIRKLVDVIYKKWFAPNAPSAIKFSEKIRRNVEKVITPFKAIYAQSNGLWSNECEAIEFLSQFEGDQSGVVKDISNYQHVFDDWNEHMFDEAQKEVEQMLMMVHHSNFLQSSIYLKHVQKQQQDMQNLCLMNINGGDSYEKQYADDGPFKSSSLINNVSHSGNNGINNIIINSFDGFSSSNSSLYSSDKSQPSRHLINSDHSPLATLYEDSELQSSINAHVNKIHNNNSQFHNGGTSSSSSSVRSSKSSINNFLLYQNNSSSVNNNTCNLPQSTSRHQTNNLNDTAIIQSNNPLHQSYYRSKVTKII